MKRVKTNDFVTVSYEGLLKNGEIFESSTDTGPLSFQVGNNEVMPAFEQAVIDMEVNEMKTITVPPEEAYGLKREDLIHTMDPALFASQSDLKPGLVVGLNMEKDGTEHQVPAMVVEVTEQGIVVDFNHPLAGESLIYQITLHSIDDKNESSENQS